MTRDTTSTIQQVIHAIRGSGGIKTTIANRLGVSRWTVDNYLNRWATARKAYLEEVETIGDLAETEMIKLIRDGYWPSIQFYLKTQAKSRGYVERQEIEQSGDVTIKVVYADPD